MFLNSVTLYVLYKALRVAFGWCQELFWLVIGPQDRRNCARVFDIRFRCKAVWESVSQECDFVFTHDQIVNFAEIYEDDRWTLHTFNRKYAYFARMPDSFNENYSIAKFPFNYNGVIEKAEQFARIDVDAFCELTSNLWDPKAEEKSTFVFLANSARCGTTLLGKMLHHEGVSMVVGEPPGISLLSKALDEGQYGMDGNDD